MPSRAILVKHATILFAYLIVVWGFYRLIFKLPDEVEEFIIKPLVWLVPVFYLLYIEKANLASVGITLTKIAPAVYLSLGLGAVFLIEALILNYFKYKGFSFLANVGSASFQATLLTSISTAVTEEITFRGYIFGRLLLSLKNEALANVLTSIGWLLIHVPVVVFVWKLDLASSISYLAVSLLYSLGAGFIYARTKNVISPILLHILWEWPVILFR